MLSLTYKKYLTEVEKYIGKDCMSICEQYLQYDTESKTCVECDEDLTHYISYDKDTWLCEKCINIYLVCDMCDNFCKFLGHDGFFYDKYNFIKYSSNRLIQRNDKSEEEYYSSSNFQICPYIEDDAPKDETYNCLYFIGYYVGYKNLIYYKVENDNYSGPDDGHDHYWKCINKNCKDYNRIFT